MYSFFCITSFFTSSSATRAKTIATFTNMFLIERLEAFCFTINRTVNINNINILQTRLTKSTSITLYILICQDSRGNTNYSRNTINVVAFLCKKKPFGATINTSTFSLLQGRNIH